MNGFGVFQEGSSLLHRLDPRSKMIAVLVFFIGAFLAHDLIGFALLIAATMLAMATGGSGAAQSARSIKPFAWLIAFVFVFDALCVVGGDVWWQLGVIGLSSKGLAFATESTVRFTCILLATSLLMRTTSPTTLTDGTALLLSPLRRLGLNIDDLALGIGMALRFIPSFTEELTAIRNAQASRGAKLTAGDESLAMRVKAHVPIVIALFAGAFRRSRTLALAIANRGYGIDVSRSCYRNYTFQWVDAAFMAITLLFAVFCAIA